MKVRLRRKCEDDFGAPMKHAARGSRKFPLHVGKGRYAGDSLTGRKAVARNDFGFNTNPALMPNMISC